MKNKDFKTLVLKFINSVTAIAGIFGGMVVMSLHFVVPFFPILFLFNICFWIGYPLFVKYVLKKEWFVCTKDDYLGIKYIMLPALVMEFMVMLYYHNETLAVIEELLENNG